MNNQNAGKKDEIEIILEKIEELQKREVREELKERFCDADFLGEGEECRKECNTRPIMLLNDDVEPWQCPTERNEDECDNEKHEKTCVFRVEKVENGAVVLRALKEKNRMSSEERDEKEKFKSTNSFITVRIANIAAVRCLKDTFVDLCIR